MSAEQLLREIKKPIADVFRRAYIKRRNLVTGLFEDNWQEITDDVISFGKTSVQIDSVRLFKFTFGTLKLVVNNNEGKYNPEDVESSLWYGYLNQQRSLVKIEAGFIKHTQTSDGRWYNSEFPKEPLWDQNLWDNDDSYWDERGSIQFKGVLSGDISLTDKDQVTLNIKPLVSIFQEFPATNLTGWTSSGMTASQFLTMIRDQTDGAGSFIFRPFFENTTTYWDISTTSVVYSNLNTGTAQGVFDKTVWEVIEKLAEAENFVPYITRDGYFKFVSRAANTSTVAFEFHGAGSFNSTYGHTIKSVSNYGKKPSKYYSMVRVKFVDADTVTSYSTVQSSFSVSPSSNPWVLGSKTLDIENFYIPNTATAATIAQNVFDDYSSLKNEIVFTTSFIPQLDILDRFSIYYDPSEVTPQSLWDQFDWGDDTSTALSTDLIWDGSKGDAIKLNGQEFKFLSLEIDIDNLENKLTAREV